MEIWLDSVDQNLIREALEFGFLFGITTNPSMLARSLFSPKKQIGMILDVQPGPVAVQVIYSDVNDMVEQGIKLRNYSDRIIVKIPAAPEGYKAMRRLSCEGVSCMATAVFYSKQYLFSALAGAIYAAPYLGRMRRKGINFVRELVLMEKMRENQSLGTKILAASIDSDELFLFCAKRNISAVTLNERMFSQIIESNEHTNESLSVFQKDWAAYGVLWDF